MSRIGDPLDDGVLYGPMHSQQGIDGFLATVKEAQALGGEASFLKHHSCIIFTIIYLSLSILCVSVVSTSHYESAGPSSISDKGSRRTAHPAIHPPKRVG